jgi:hypothetical protein
MKYLKFYENIDFDNIDNEEYELDRDTVSDELKDKGIVTINTYCGVWELFYENFSGLFTIQLKNDNSIFLYATPYWDKHGIPIDFYRFNDSEDPIYHGFIELPNDKYIKLDEYINIMKEWIENNICY